MTVNREQVVPAYSRPPTHEKIHTTASDYKSEMRQQELVATGKISETCDQMQSKCLTTFEDMKPAKGVDTGVKRYQCVLCKNIFRKKRNFEIHGIIHSG